MPSVPTTSLDLSAPDVVADPYPYFAEERAAHPVAWHEPSGMLLTFDHASVSAVPAGPAAGPASGGTGSRPTYLEPFNLLHRNQMMENEPPEHTRLRRPVAAAFNRGPRRAAAAAGRARSPPSCSTDVDPDGFDVIGEYAEPLPVLVIAELLGVPSSHADDLRRLVAGDRADVRGGAAPRRWWTRRCAAASEFAGAGARAGRRARGSTPARRPDQRPGGQRADRRTRWWPSAVLLLNAGHEASVNVFGNGLVAMLRRGLRPGADVAAVRGGDAPLRLGAAAVRAHRHRGRSRSADVVGRGRARRSRRCWARPTATRRSSSAPDELRRRPRPQPARRVRRRACTSASARRWPGWSWRSRWRRCGSGSPTWRWSGEPESRGTFVLRGFRRVHGRREAACMSGT